MHEFIVWDKKSKKFRPLNCIVYNTSGHYDLDKKDIDIKLVNCWGQPFKGYETEDSNPNILVKREKGQFTIHKAIGKTDINNKKIYADSSIVEFKYKSNHPLSILKEEKGVFIFYNPLLQYCIRTFEENELYTIQGLRDLKIIDTIQENKLGLIK